MLNYKKLRQRDRALKALCGMGLIAFNALLKTFHEIIEEEYEARRKNKNRRRKVGGGGKPVLSCSAEKLMFILLYWKTYPTQDLLGVLFGQSQSWACKWIYRLIPLLEKALHQKMELPLRPAVSTMEELRRKCPELDFVIDGTERPIRRPKDKEKQKENYSGKKKRHTKKNIAVGGRNREEKGKVKVIFLGNTYPGKKHDKRSASGDNIPFPEGSHIEQDTGFVGYKKEGSTMAMPKKKPKGGELTAEEKANNKEISRRRIVIEHMFAGIKTFQIVHDVFRNKKEGMDDKALYLACGLYNLKLDCCQKMAA